MIYTLTLNPSIDYIVELDAVSMGKLNRTKREEKFPGGKGINVSQVLKRFDIESTALGFIGGFTGDYIESFLSFLKVNTDFVKIQADTRINVKIKTDTETEINATGPSITKAEYEALKEKIKRLTSDDTLILSGSIPSSLPASTYEELVEICRDQEIRFIVDAEGDLLKRILPYRPFLIKPNHHELGQFFQTTITTVDEVISYAKKLNQLGARNVIVSLAGEGAVFVNDASIYTATAPKGEVKSSVGAGDSMVAGFLAALEKTNSIEEAFQYSVASGSATAFSIGLCTKERVETLLPQILLENKLDQGD